MNPRRANRIAAVQFIYMWSVNPQPHLGDELLRFFETQEKPRDFYGFAEELIHGFMENQEAVDAIIKSHAKNWDFERIAKIDLAILRLAIYEMTFRNDIPPIVSINEAIDLSKIFSIEDAKRFINGILDKYKLELSRPLRQASDN